MIIRKLINKSSWISLSNIIIIYLGVWIWAKSEKYFFLDQTDHGTTQVCIMPDRAFPELQPDLTSSLRSNWTTDCSWPQRDLKCQSDLWYVFNSIGKWGMGELQSRFDISIKIRQTGDSTEVYSPSTHSLRVGAWSKVYNIFLQYKIYM